MLNRMSKFGIVGVLAVATVMFVTPQAAFAGRDDSRGGRVDSNRGGDRGGSDRAGNGWDRGNDRGSWDRGSDRGGWDRGNDRNGWDRGGYRDRGGWGVGISVPATRYETVYVSPGRWDDRATRVWVPPVCNTRAVGCVTTVVTSRVSVAGTFRW